MRLLERHLRLPIQDEAKTKSSPFSCMFCFCFFLDVVVPTDIETVYIPTGQVTGVFSNYKRTDKIKVRMLRESDWGIIPFIN